MGGRKHNAMAEGNFAQAISFASLLFVALSLFLCLPLFPVSLFAHFLATSSPPFLDPFSLFRTIEMGNVMFSRSEVVLI